MRDWIKKSYLGALVLMGLSLHAAEIQDVKIPASKMGRSISATVILPDSYKSSSTERFPVLYLLHGAGDSNQKWNKETNIAALADQYKMIVISPNAGRTSWYFDSPIDPKFQYETFVAKDCVKYMDKHYRTKADKQHRALCGNSMGGHGALYLGIRHLDTFATAVSLSGGVDIRPFAGKWKIARRLGSKKKYPEVWEKNTVINLAKGLKKGQLAISIDVGDHDFFLKVNRALDKQLTKDGIKHNYEEHPGAHGWDYWRLAIKRQMPFIDKQFKK